MGVQAILAGAGTQFDPTITDVFSRLVAPFPPGVEVDLTDGRRAVVVSVSELALDRPVVRVISGPDAPVDISLTADPSIQIAGWNPAPAALDRSGRLGPRPAAARSASSFPPPWPIQLSVLHPRKDQAPVSFVISSVRRQLLAAFAAV